MPWWVNSPHDSPGLPETWCFIPSWLMPFTTEALPPLAWLVLSHVSSSGLPQHGVEAHPRDSLAEDAWCSPHILCVPAMYSIQLKTRKGNTPEMLGPRLETGLQEQAKPVAHLLYPTLRFTFAFLSSPNL